MKKLILMRHAKSSWNNPGQADAERELNPRGLRNAPEMGLRLKEKNWPVDLVVCSTATRTRQTAALVVKAIGYPVQHIDYKTEIYEAQISDLKHVVQSIDDAAQSVLLIGHNPGLTYFTDFLSNCGHIHMPTAAMMYLELDVTRWHDVKAGCGRLVEYDFPKRDPFDPD